MANPYLYIILNGELKMSAGKAAAQTAHVVSSLFAYYETKGFGEEPRRTVIVLEAKNQQQIDNLEKYLMNAEIPAVSYIDEGHNEVAPFSTTALAVGPFFGEEYEIDEQREIFKQLPLYGKKKKWYKR